jgi:hypothetical protein
LGDSLKEKILRLPGVTGVAVEGGKYVVYTDGSHNYSEVDGVPVTCLKAEDKEHRLSTIQATSLQVSSEVRRERWRPIPGGVSGAYIYSTAGTIGMKVYRDGESFLLSNTHIFGDKVGFPILQPSPYDGGKSDDAVIENADFVPISINQMNEVDAALGYSHTELSENILDIGVIHGVINPRLLMKIEKSGRDGYSTGRVISTDGMFKVFYEKKGTALFDGVIVTTAMAKPGASGSIGTHAGSAVGLLFAGSPYVTLYIPMTKVVQRLRLDELGDGS